jgi:hypothetical protein
VSMDMIAVDLAPVPCAGFGTEVVPVRVDD